MPPAGIGRIAIIGDIHGHPDAFAAALEHCGADPARGLVPDGITIMQAGDLVHTGPDSGAAVEIAGRLLARSPGRYVQLWGNHDCHHAGGPDVSSRASCRPIPAAAASTLRRWWESRAARLAFAANTAEHGPVLITHAGLTAGLWRELGSVACPFQAAARINALLDDPVRAFRPGELMTGVTDFSAGVTGALTGSELAASWLEAGAMPFTQIHGHDGVWSWADGSFRPGAPPEALAASFVDPQSRRSWVTIGERRLWCIDAKLGQGGPGFSWHPLILDLA